MSCCDAIIYELADKDFSDDGKSLNVRSPFMLVLYKAQWCPHCQHFVGTWERLAKNYRRSTCLCFGEVEQTKGNVTKVRDVRGFPTLRLYDNVNKRMYEYHGDRSYKDVEKFLDNYIS
jgi:thiol-disulfide isomerase/thioredoxin